MKRLQTDGKDFLKLIPMETQLQKTAVTSLAVTPSKAHTENWKRSITQVISKPLEISPSTALTVVNGFYAPIKSLENANGLLLRDLPLIAKEYGARVDILRNVLLECVRLVREKFSHYGLDEIREAYRLTSIGKVDADKMWGGEFNAAQLGSVLSNYELYRANVINAYKSQEYTMKREKARILEDKKKQIEYNDNFDNMLTEMIPNWETWQDVPSWLWPQVFDRNLITISGKEAKDIYAEAILIATNQIEREKVEQKYKKPMQAKTIMKESDNRIEPRAKLIAGQITVYRKLKS